MTHQCVGYSQNCVALSECVGYSQNYRDSLPESDGRRDDSDSDSDDDPMQNHMRPALLHLLSTAHPTSRAGLPNADIALRVPGNVNLGDGGAVAVFVVDTVWKCDLPRTSPSILGPVQASNQLFRRTTVIPCVVLLLALPRSFYFNSCYFYHFSPRFGFPLRDEDLVHFT
ncbi:hypothetical protein B0H14DRAFT_2926580 [Mycena olivaceomarginata]|nr:hypothetical protein B0H14DRAFT_2951003 [Mycena olivaceomarginata]KAJ7793515.1 hypothetical protein B0H14DRAFT_2926580 [Mycena olivaceomarginata]